MDAHTYGVTYDFHAYSKQRAVAGAGKVDGAWKVGVWTWSVRYDVHMYFWTVARTTPQNTLCTVNVTGPLGRRGSMEFVSVLCRASR